MAQSTYDYRTDQWISKPLSPQEQAALVAKIQVQQEEKEEEIPTLPPAKQSNLDLLSKQHTYYHCIINPGDSWFDEAELQHILDWYKTHVQALVTTEHASFQHLHALIASKTAKTGNVTRSLEQLFKRHSIPFEKGVTIKVRKSTVPIGHFHYLMDPAKKGKVLVTHGWRLTWIQDQCRQNPGKKPRKLLEDGTRVVHNREGPRLIADYAEAHNLHLTCKTDFIGVVTDMESKGFQFHKCKKKDLLTNTLAMQGHTACTRSLWEMELMMIDG